MASVLIDTLNLTVLGVMFINLNHGVITVDKKMNTDTPRLNAMRETIRSYPIETQCDYFEEIAYELERELTESKAQSHGLARRVVEAETKLEVVETQLAKAHEELCQAGLREYGV